MKNTTIRNAFALSALCTLFASPSQAQVNFPKAFTVTDLGQVDTLGGLNNKADVSAVGVHFGRGFVFRTSSGIRDLVPSHPGSGPIATGVNTTAFANDTIIGTDRGLSSFLFSQSVNAAPIGMAHASANFGAFIGDTPLSINNAGTSVGTTQFIIDANANFTWPTRWTPSANGTTATLLNTGGNVPGTNILITGSARDINNFGTIVGEANRQACIFREGLAPLLLAGSNSAANGISDTGFITGFMPSGNRSRAFLMAPGGSPIIAPLPNFAFSPGQVFVNSVGNKVNSAGTAAGAAMRVDGTSFAFIWRLGANGGWADLNTWSAKEAGTLLTEAVDINDRGDILCYGRVNGVRHGFLLRPNGNLILFRQF